MRNTATSVITQGKEISYSRALLSKFIATWEKRAQVRHYVLPSELNYEIDRPDFLEELLPIKNCISYKNLTPLEKNKLLSWGWLAYNAKTIAIESKIISPVCYDIIHGHVPGVSDNHSGELIAETLTDESYHILLIHHVMAVAEKNRKINRYMLPEFDLIKRMHRLQDQHSEDWQKILIRLAVAVVSEIFVSDYLKSLSVSQKIVTLNREAVRAHRMDEVAHGKIFTWLIRLIYRELNNREKSFFSSILHFPVRYFASKELAVWDKILRQVCPHAADAIMEEAVSEEWFDLSRIDYSPLILLAEEMGIQSFAERLNGGYV